jgi:hypothetical protein
LSSAIGAIEIAIKTDDHGIEQLCSYVLAGIIKIKVESIHRRDHSRQMLVSTRYISRLAGLVPFSRSLIAIYYGAAQSARGHYL